MGVLLASGVPNCLHGKDAVDWLLANSYRPQRQPGVDNADNRWRRAATGTMMAMRRRDMAAQLSRLPAAHLEGILATAAAQVRHATATPEFYRDFLVDHRRQIQDVAEALDGPPSERPQPYAPLDPNQAHDLLTRALTVPVDNDLQGDCVDLVRTLAVDVAAYRCPHAYGQVLYLGAGRWQGEMFYNNPPVDQRPADIEGGLAVYLVAPGRVEAVALNVTPDPFLADELVIGHAAQTLAAGGLSRVTGEIGYEGPWAHVMSGWRFDPTEDRYNVDQLRRAVLEGSRHWVVTHSADAFQVYLQDLHRGAGAANEVLCMSADGVHETVPAWQAAIELWRPLLDRGVDELAELGPPTGVDTAMRDARVVSACQHVGGWVFTTGELTLRGQRDISEAERCLARVGLERPDLDHALHIGHDGPDLGPGR